MTGIEPNTAWSATAFRERTLRRRDVRKVEGPPNGLSDEGASPEAVRQAAQRTNVLESKTKRGQARGCIPRAVRFSVSQTR